MKYSKTDIMTALKQERELLIKESKQRENKYNSLEGAVKFLKENLKGVN
jgi:hypothetical protein